MAHHIPPNVSCFARYENLVDHVFHAHDGAVLRLLGANALLTVRCVDDHAVTDVDGHVGAALSAVGAVTDDVTFWISL